MLQLTRSRSSGLHLGFWRLREAADACKNICYAFFWNLSKESDKIYCQRSVFTSLRNFATETIIYFPA